MLTARYQKRTQASEIAELHQRAKVLEQSFRLNFKTINNVAEYEALVAGLKLAWGLKITKHRAFCDSQLVANQFNEEYTARDE